MLRVQAHLLVACSAAQAVVDFSAFYVSSEGLSLRHSNFSNTLSVESVLCSEVIVGASFLVFFNLTEGTRFACYYGNTGSCVN